MLAMLNTVTEEITEIFRVLYKNDLFRLGFLGLTFLLLTPYITEREKKTFGSDGHSLDLVSDERDSVRVCEGGC